MGMSVGGSGGDGEVEPEMNTTPLIDVMLVLLVMLIITIPIQTHAVKLDMPSGSPPPQSNVEPTVFRIDVDFDGTIIWNGEIVSSGPDLESRLTSAALMNPQPEVHLRPNKLVKYRYVAHVLANAQRLGVQKIGLVGNEQFVD